MANGGFMPPKPPRELRKTVPPETEAKKTEETLSAQTQKVEFFSDVQKPAELKSERAENSAEQANSKVAESSVDLVEKNSGAAENLADASAEVLKEGEKKEKRGKKEKKKTEFSNSSNWLLCGVFSIAFVLLVVLMFV